MAEEGTNNLIFLAIGIIIFALIIGVGIYIITNMNTSLLTTNTAGQSNFTYTTPATLTAQEGITSNSIITPNQTWLYFTNYSNSYVNTTNFVSINMSNGYSMSIWFRSTTNDSTDQGYMIELVNKTSNFPYSHISLRAASGKPRVLFRTIINSSGCSFSNADDIPTINRADGNWHFATFVFNKTALLGYVDGVSVTNQTFTQPCLDLYNSMQNMSNRIEIGANQLIGYYIGSLDEAKVYAKSLSDAEITQLYNQGRVENRTLLNDSLVLYYPMNEGSGTTVYDASGNNNNGAMVGF